MSRVEESKGPRRRSNRPSAFEVRVRGNGIRLRPLGVVDERSWALLAEVLRAADRIEPGGDHRITYDGPASPE